MIDEDFPSSSTYNTTLGVLYFTDTKPSAMPASVSNVQPPNLSPEYLEDPGNIGPYQMNVLGRIAPPQSTRTITFTIDMFNEPQGADNAVQYAHFNNISLLMTPDTPSLLERLSNNPAGLGPPQNHPPAGGRGWHIVDIALGEVIDIVINNDDDGEHPVGSSLAAASMQTPQQAEGAAALAAASSSSKVLV